MQTELTQQFERERKYEEVVPEIGEEEQECTACKGINPIKNKDNLCFPRAIVVALANINQSSLYTNIRENLNKHSKIYYGI